MCWQGLYNKVDLVCCCIYIKGKITKFKARIAFGYMQDVLIIKYEY